MDRKKMKWSKVDEIFGVERWVLFTSITRMKSLGFGLIF
jgi:hypothetical protein